MQPIVSIIMGSTSDLPVMEKAAKFLDEMGIYFEMNALSAHRTPAEVEAFAREAKGRGIKVIIAGAGMAAALPGVLAASTTVPVIGALNAAILAAEMLALADTQVAERVSAYKAGLKDKIVKANKELAEVKYEFKTN